MEITQTVAERSNPDEPKSAWRITTVTCQGMAGVGTTFTLMTQDFHPDDIVHAPIDGERLVAKRCRVKPSRWFSVPSTN